MLCKRQARGGFELVMAVRIYRRRVKKKAKAKKTFTADHKKKVVDVILENGNETICICGAEFFSLLPIRIAYLWGAFGGFKTIFKARIASTKVMVRTFVRYHHLSAFLRDSFGMCQIDLTNFDSKKVLINLMQKAFRATFSSHDKVSERTRKDPLIEG